MVLYSIIYFQLSPEQPVILLEQCHLCQFVAIWLNALYWESTIIMQIPQNNVLKRNIKSHIFITIIHFYSFLWFLFHTNVYCARLMNTHTHIQQSHSVFCHVEKLWARKLCFYVCSMKHLMTGTIQLVLFVFNVELLTVLPWFGLVI